MGLSIHYSGTIKHVNLIPLLIDEVNDICTALHWNCTIINNDELNGIIFSPKNSEPLFFTFSKTGKLYSPALLKYNTVFIFFSIEIIIVSMLASIFDGNAAGNSGNKSFQTI